MDKNATTVLTFHVATQFIKLVSNHKKLSDPLQMLAFRDNWLSSL